MEGDNQWKADVDGQITFLSTPSGWRATGELSDTKSADTISIHALRVEGDVVYIFNTVYKRKISIHALRVEGDC